ncbi:MAG: hypothetical protein ACOYN0_16415, partial [Phycisphaerales bacterium]
MKRTMVGTLACVAILNGPAHAANQDPTPESARIEAKWDPDGQRVSVVVGIEGEECTIVLTRSSPLAADCVIVVDDGVSRTSLPPTAPLTFRGTVDCWEHSAVAASFDENGRLSALIDPGVEGAAWIVIEPAPALGPNPDNLLHVVYRTSDIRGGRGECGVPPGAAGNAE